MYTRWVTKSQDIVISEPKIHNRSGHQAGQTIFTSRWVFTTGVCLVLSGTGLPGMGSLFCNVGMAGELDRAWKHPSHQWSKYIFLCAHTKKADINVKRLICWFFDILMDIFKIIYRKGLIFIQLVISWWKMVSVFVILPSEITAHWFAICSLPCDKQFCVATACTVPNMEGVCGSACSVRPWACWCRH